MDGKPANAIADDLDLTHEHSGTDLKPVVAGGSTDLEGTLKGPCGPVET